MRRFMFALGVASTLTGCASMGQLAGCGPAGGSGFVRQGTDLLLTVASVVTQATLGPAGLIARETVRQLPPLVEAGYCLGTAASAVGATPNPARAWSGR